MIIIPNVNNQKTLSYGIYLYIISFQYNFIKIPKGTHRKFVK